MTQWQATEDHELLSAWCDGDRDAGDVLVERHFPSVCRFFRSKLGDDTQDLIQATFAGCLEAAPHFEVRASGFRAFLFRIARNRLYDELRRRGRLRSFDPASRSLADLGMSPSSVAAHNQEARLLERALRTLPLDQQIALELFYWEDLSGREIASILDVSPHTVRSRLARAREELRKQVQRLAETPELGASTGSGLESWARCVGRLALGTDEPPA